MCILQGSCFSQISPSQMLGTLRLVVKAISVIFPESTWYSIWASVLLAIIDWMRRASNAIFAIRVKISSANFQLESFDKIINSE